MAGVIVRECLVGSGGNAQRSQDEAAAAEPMAELLALVLEAAPQRYRVGREVHGEAAVSAAKLRAEPALAGQGDHHLQRASPPMVDAQPGGLDDASGDRGQGGGVGDVGWAWWSQRCRGFAGGRGRGCAPGVVRGLGGWLGRCVINARGVEGVELVEEIGRCVRRRRLGRGAGSSTSVRP